MKSPLCFDCQEKGHLSFRCPQKRLNATALITGEEEIVKHEKQEPHD